MKRVMFILMAFVLAMGVALAGDYKIPLIGSKAPEFTANWEDGDDVLVPYFPYTKEELALEPELKDQYYNVGDRMWFKRIGESAVKK